jgi:hypothetical protein
MDRVYKSAIPAMVKNLERLRAEFSQHPTATNWGKLRIEPLLEHARSLEQILQSKEFAREISRLRRGVEMFHADLVYLRTNIRGLEKILEAQAETPRASRRPRTRP